MKTRITKKAIVDRYQTIIADGGNMQDLLNYKNADFFTAGVNGWNSDIYILEHEDLYNTIVISTGDRAFGNISTSYWHLMDYEKKARAIVGNYDIKYEDKKEQVNKLLYTYINEVLENADLLQYKRQINNIVRKYGGHREKNILEHSYILSRGTWNNNHKVINVLNEQADNDGYKQGFAVDIVTQSIVG